MQSVILGTAQWGLDYGATNPAGRLTDEVLVGLASHAWASGIRNLDTSPAYGDAEIRIGGLPEPYAVQTKVLGERGARGVLESFNSSLSRLGRQRITSVLIHDWSSLEGRARAEAAEAVEGLRSQGRCELVGVSAYEAGDILVALETFSRLDVVQVPASVLDQRLCGSAAITAARAAGARIQARSVFLQGAALAGHAHPVFGGNPDIERLHASGADPLRMCLGWVVDQEWIDDLVVAATSEQELFEILAALSQPEIRDDWASFASWDRWLIDPRGWSAPTKAGLGANREEEPT